MAQPTFIDLFAGIGGFRLGFQNAGFECVFSSEVDLHAQKVYAANYGEAPFGDIHGIHSKNVPFHNVICAGFPCQAFSISGKQRGFQDTRGTLFFEILRIAQSKQPQVLVLENVKNLLYHDKTHTLKTIEAALKEIGYHVRWSLLNAKDFGLPQSRERVIIVASKAKPFDFSLLQTKPAKTIQDILQNKKTLDILPADSYTLLPPAQRVLQKSGLIFAGYLNKEMRKNGVRPGTEQLSRSHRQQNRIYDAKGIHPTLSSSESSGRYFVLHQGVVRKMSLPECYALMGFPSDFQILPPASQAYRRIGNSVCVPMITEVAKSLRKQALL